jgi:hypothetical protein
MIHLDPRHKLTQEFVALFDTLSAPAKPEARKARKR